jgi:DNA-binding winged helix-turn-helix (wHTH) protein/TolB-like protein
MHVYRFANLVFTPEDGRLRNERAGNETSLRPQVARLLENLLAHAGEVIPRERLHTAVWGEEAVVDFESGLAALMRELRQSVRAVEGPDDLVETVPRRGYRLDAAVRVDGGSRSGRWRVAVLLSLLLPVLLGAGYGVWLALEGLAPEPPGEYSLAILPFENYERSAELPDHVGLLMADTLLAELLARPVEGLELLGRTSLRPYLGREDVVSALAGDLGVELLVEGSVTGRADQGWQAEMRLLAVPPGRVVWSSTVTGEPGRPLDVRAVAGTMAEDLVEAWPSLRERLGREG